MRQISEANEAAYQALYGLAQGTAQHAFITARIERMGECHEQLIELVGEHEALCWYAAPWMGIALLAETFYATLPLVTVWGEK